MRHLALPLSLALACASSGCATGRPEPRPDALGDDFERYDALLADTERLRAAAGHLVLRARAQDAAHDLAERLRSAALACASRAQDLPRRAEDLAARHPDDSRSREAQASAAALAVKLRASAQEAEAAAGAVTAAATVPHDAAAAATPTPSAPPAPSEAPPDLVPESTGSETDVVAAGAARAAGALGSKLRAHLARRLSVTPTATVIGDEMPRLGLTFGNRGSEADVHGRVFARKLAAALSQQGFKAAFSSDVASQLAAAPSSPQKDVSQVALLVYGALAVDPGRFAAWDLRAVDLNDEAILAETQGVYRVR